MKINNITGSPVEGENFYGREKELSFAWSKVLKGNSLILSAPRRVGKSSFAKKLLENAKKENWNTLEINLEEVSSEIGFVNLLIEKLQAANWWQSSMSKAERLFGQILESIKPSIGFGETKVSVEWSHTKIDVYQKLKGLINHEEDTLIMVDELTILLNRLLKNENGKQDVEFFLNWLRSFRQVSGTKIRWVFCSSIGIENFTSMHNLSYALNDVTTFKIDEYNIAEAYKFVEELANSEAVQFTKEDINFILQLLGWNLPYFIQILFSNINQLIQVQGKTTSTDTINEAYTQLISESHLNTWDERLNEYGEYEIYVRFILKNLSTSKEGAGRAVLFSLLFAKINDEDKTEFVLCKLLQMLQNDGYLILKKNSNYIFRSPLLRDFWNNRFVK